jgi:hypothetical protein
MKTYRFILLLTLIFLVSSSLFATVDARVVLISNTMDSPVAGQATLVMDIEAISNAGAVNVGGFQGGIVLDAAMRAQYISSTFTNQLFTPAAYTTTQDYNTTTAAGRLRFIYTYNAGAYGNVGTTYTPVVRITVVYNMIAATTTNITWRVGAPTWTVLDQAGTGNITGVQEAIPVTLTTVPLPVELTSFTASANRLDAQLSWSTATEKNNYGFEIERRQIDAAEWNKVGFVAGAGTKSSPSSYTYTDLGVAPGRYAYRVKQIDVNGSFQYGSSAEVEIGLVAKALTLSDAYPNPFNPTAKIEFTLPSDGRAILKVYNTIGQEVANLFDGQASAGRIIQAQFDARSLSSGLYFARLQFGGKTLLKKMLFVK